MSNHILTMTLMKALREKASITVDELAGITKIPKARLLELESKNRHRACEPWFYEAQRIALALGYGGIYPLLTLNDPEALDLGTDPRDDFDVWRVGEDLPLSTACRLARRFKLSDPMDLIIPPPALLRQVWAVLDQGERSLGPGFCPWCAVDRSAGEDHLSTCVPFNLLGARGTLDVSAIGTSPRPAYPGRNKTGSKEAPGLLTLRMERGTTQAQFAASIGANWNHYAKLERGDVKLTFKLAEYIAGIYQIDVARLYAPRASTPRIQEITTVPAPSPDPSETLT